MGPRTRVLAGKRTYVMDNQTLGAYFKPGDVVPSYGGAHDRVVSFTPGTDSTRFSVRVLPVNADGSPITGAVERSHSTQPMPRDLTSKFGPAAKQPPSPRRNAKQSAPAAAVEAPPAAPAADVDTTAPVADTEDSPAEAPKAVAEAAATAATSPDNDLADATPAQREAGNFKMGRMKAAGLDVSIEYPAGVKRKADHQALTRAYGYFRGTVGKDKDHVDVFLGERADDASLPVFVIDQMNQAGKFDEHKIVMGEETEAAAREAYLSNYPDGWTGLGGITEMSQEQFKAWVQDPHKTKRRLSRAPRAAAAPVEADRTTRAEPAGPVADVGEKIGGARKDSWKEHGLRLSDLENMTGGEQAMYAVKANVW
jgi:hypothetical protein